MLDLLIQIVVLSIATWRITFMVNREHGPAGVFEKFRQMVGLVPWEEASSAQQSKWIKENLGEELAPVYIHDGNNYAIWVECMNCLSVSIAAILGTFMVLTNSLPLNILVPSIFVASAATIWLDTMGEGE